MTTPAISARYIGPWPLVSDLVRAELRGVLDATKSADVQDLGTRCPPWSVHDVTAHLAATFRRYVLVLERSRTGDFSQPFPRDQLSQENLKTVAVFEGEPRAELQKACERFIELARDAAEPVAHQFGTIPVGLKMLFGLNELAIHHDDIAQASGGSYRPAPTVIDALLPVWERVLGLTEEEIEDPWARIIAASGRED